MVSLRSPLLKQFTIFAQNFSLQALVLVTTLTAPPPGVLATEFVGRSWKNKLFILVR